MNMLHSRKFTSQESRVKAAALMKYFLASFMGQFSGVGAGFQKKSLRLERKPFGINLVSPEFNLKHLQCVTSTASEAGCQR